MASSLITDAVIMAAGKGTRMRPLTLTTPKPMLEVGGRPILAWTIDALPESIAHVVLIVGYLQEQIREYFGTDWHGRRITYVEQTELTGTGSSVHHAEPFVGERFLVLNADDLYCNQDMQMMCSSPEMAILAKPLTVPGRFSAFDVDDDGRLRGIMTVENNAIFSEQKNDPMINTGLYVLDRRYFSWPLVPISAGGEFGLPHTIAAQCNDVRVNIIPATFWYPIGFPEDIEGAAVALAGRGGKL